jgi:hypothetical protein
VTDWQPSEEKPLTGVKRCKLTDCAHDLHCFLKDKKRVTPDGTCLSCGADLIDWRRMHQRDLADIDHTIRALKYEHIRHEFWCTVPLTERAVSFARKHGRKGILQEARTRVEVKLVQPGNFADWGQTPFEDKGNAIHFAQHATATCCRRCIEVWHGIARDQVLSASEVEYLAQLILRYVVDRLPDLLDDAIVPPAKPRQARAMRKVS